MINRLLYVATATALLSVLVFDETFAANLSRPSRRGSRDHARSVGGGDGGVVGVWLAAAFYRERRR